MEIIWLLLVMISIIFVIRHVIQSKHRKPSLEKPEENTPYQGKIQGESGVTLHYNVTARRKTKSEEKSSNLLKEATGKKYDGDLDGAIACLREAYGLMSKDATIYPIDTYLRLPLYLQQAGRYAEAIAEFQYLICNTPAIIAEEFSHAPKHTQDSLVAMRYAGIFDKIRLSAYREKHFTHAAYYKLLSLANRAIGLKLQSREEELNSFRDRSLWIDELLPLLKKSKKDSLLERLVEICIDFARQCNTNSLVFFAKEVKSILRIDLSSIGVKMPDIPEILSH